MLNGKYIPLDRVIERFYQDYGLQDRVDWSWFIELISECMGLMGVPIGYIDKTAEVTIEDYMGALPCDYFMYTGVRDYTTKVPLRETTDIYHYSGNENTSSYESTTLDNTFSINNNYIKTDTNYTGTSIELAYMAVPTDNRGWPMIPDDDKVIRMLISYLGYKNGFKMYIQKQIDERMYDKFAQEYYFNAAAARTRLLTPSVDRMESIKNSFLRLIPKINEHATGFKTLGQQEERNIY